jgi:intraflagellar transport protein 81
VDRLNGHPFNKDLTLVAFDELSPFELLELVNEVLTHLDDRHGVDLRDEEPSVTAARWIEFLTILKYTIPPPVERFQGLLMRADRNVVYPLLHYLVQRLPQLKKRAYLARFLMTIKIPQQFALDPQVAEVFGQYKELQKEFKDVHKTLDRLQGSSLSPGDLKKEITQLEEEKHQLHDKIENLQRKTNGMEGFEELLKVTSALRREQEEEAKLDERMAEQQSQLAMAGRRYQEISRKLIDLKQSMGSDGSISAEQLLERLEEDVRALERNVRDDLPKEFRARKEKLEKLQRALSEPAKSEADVQQVQQEVRMLQREIQRLNDTIAESNGKRGDDSLAVYRQQGALIAKKLEQKEEQVEKAEEARDRLKSKIEDMESQLRQMPGGRMMRGDEFKTYAANLRNKTGQFKKLKEELADLRQETVVLSRTEAILKSRCKGLEGFMKDLEERHGVEGYTATEDKLEQVSSLTAALNQTKGKTLEEISKIVTDINQALKERKNKLAPQIKELRSVRGTYQELETAYLEKKGIFENTAAGLESERVKLEQECGSYQDECLREESRYHLLNCMMQKTTVDLERTRMEDKFSRNDGRLLPDFKTFSDLYQNKISQQQSLSQALRKHQNALKENAPQDGVQRAMFDDLRRLLDTKTVIHRNKEANEGGVEDVNVASFEEYGGTNVMKIDQGGP